MLDNWQEHCRVCGRSSFQSYSLLIYLCNSCIFEPDSKKKTKCICDLRAVRHGALFRLFLFISFLMMLLTLQVLLQYYHLYLAQNVSYPVDGAADSMLRHSCLDSDKGGKRAVGDISDNTYNPCWCHAGAVCGDKVNGGTYSGSTCPTDGTTSCYELTPGEVPSSRHITVRVSTKRDCRGGRRGECTREEPCTPCETSKAALFGLRGIGEGSWERCSTCSPENRCGYTARHAFTPPFILFTHPPCIYCGSFFFAQGGV